ncbi:tumor necrosis factor receptor superfamily member 19L isoform X2 [Bombina bombina]|uniref:tumor necrosis factor receptor superfamily member 19L isoform X2 n=1 Tax=Bombina bombina TaxID=8345 RepID=UPI00235AEF38|nr:tumor necrosis factor receptor superfamily member 19L isoform X2 [Bombina bombina]
MMGNTCTIFLAILLTLLLQRGQCQLECNKGEYRTEDDQCVPCIECQPGEEPDGVCGFGTGAEVACRRCSPGMFSSRIGRSPCIMHTQCDKRRRVQLSPGTLTADVQCGDCLSGFFSPVAKTSNPSTCFPCWLAPADTVGCEGIRTLRPRSPRTIDASTKQDNRMTLNSTLSEGQGDSGTQYAVLAIVPVFCMMGLSGILLCNFLKKKGYHCTSQKEQDEEAPPAEKAEFIPPCVLEENGNEDTIGVLVRLITEKKENAAALEELLKDHQSRQLSQSPNKAPHKLHLLPQMPHLCKHQHHLHTVQGLASCSGPCCTRCSQKKWTDVLVPPETVPKGAVSNTKGSKPVTILSVGRFRVARIAEQKPSPPEVKAPIDCEESKNVPCDDCAEQRVLLCNALRAKNRSMEDTSKLEDVI